MSYHYIIGGIICCVIAILVFPAANKRLKSGEVNHLTIKGYLLSILLVAFGAYFIVREIAKII